MKQRAVIIIFAVLWSACGNVQITPSVTPSPRPPSTSTAAITPTPAINQTTHGHIRGDEIWQGEIRIIGDIIVENNATLTIMPGTLVYVAAHQDTDNLFIDPFDMQIGVKEENNTDRGVHQGEPYRDEGHHISIVVHGELNAIGTPDQGITFTSDSPKPTGFDWNKLSIARGTISHALFEYYRTMDVGSKVTLTNSEMRHVGECAVCANSSALIQENHIWDAGHELIDVHRNSPQIINNLLGPYPNRFAIVLDGGSPSIKGNTFRECGGGILMISPSTPRTENNEYIHTPVQVGTEY